MDIGDALIVSGLIFALGGVITGYLSLKHDPRLRVHSRALYIASFASMSLALAYLSYLFASLDISYHYVWSRAAPSMEDIYRISAVWSGGEGALLLWLWFCSLALAIQVAFEGRLGRLGRPFHVYSQIALAAMTIVFALVTARLGLFERTLPIELAAYPDGKGLLLILQTPEMVVHPPVIFASYAACLGLFAVALGHFMTGDSGWNGLAISWGRVSWVLLTLGIGIGAVWAYYVVGWGGYWYWDPVETSSLVPWFVVTAFLHAMTSRLPRPEYPVMAPALGMLSFVAVLYAAFVTRTGGLWGSSVHTYGASSGANIGEKLVNLLANDGTVAGFFALVAGLFILTLAVAYFRMQKSEVEPEDHALEKLSDWVNDRNNMALTILLMLTAVCVLIAIMVKNTDVSPSLNNTEFNQKMSLLFVGISIVMSVCLTWKTVGRDRVLMIVIATAVASSALTGYALVTDSIEPLLALSLPAYGIALVSAIVSISRTRFGGCARDALHRIGPGVIHLGIAAILIGFAASTQAQKMPDLGEWVEVGVGEEVQVGGFVVHLVSISVEEVDGLAEGYYLTTVVDFEIEVWTTEPSSLKDVVVLTNIYGGPATQTGYDRLDGDVHVHSTLLVDLYMCAEWASDASAMLHLKTLPMMILVWGGLCLVCAGAATRTFTQRRWQR